MVQETSVSKYWKAGSILKSSESTDGDKEEF